MKEIPLTQGKRALVNDEDFERVNQWKWFVHWSPKTNSFYAVRSDQSVTPHVFISMARFILEYSGNRVVDHRNHNTLNNQRYNIRVCTESENARNKRKASDCSSKYKGVCWHKTRNKWIAQIQTRDIFDQIMNIFLGHFENEEEAALAYDKAASEEFEEFACLNFPRRSNA